ncbi:MAG: Sjogren's syndrome/scleroderma autoantigen 1 family protein [Candidatus Gagatemarchaeaceae archaeon]
MSRPTKDKIKVAVELVRKGATILGEPCPQCGGIQVRYHGKVYCTGHEDLSSVLKTEVVSMETAVAETRQVLLSKLNEAAAALGTETDRSKQDQLVSLMTKYFDLLQKLPQK